MGATEDSFHALALKDGIQLERRASRPGLTNHGHLDGAPASGYANSLQAIYRRLGGGETQLAAKQRRPLQLDFVMRERNLIVEVDEIQHFTSDRLSTFEHYERGLEVPYDFDQYCTLIRSWRIVGDRYRAAKEAAGFSFPGGRRAQRAYFDACRDLAAPEVGLRVLRVPAPECDATIAYRRFLDQLTRLNQPA
jgi:very-short-patch-repair endonuclease